MDAAARPRSVVILGVGSELRSDDAAGLHVAAAVAGLGLPGVRAVAGGSAPENATGEVRTLSPTHLLIVDAADMGETPGTVRVIRPEEVGGISFSTHTLPLNIIADYLSQETGCAVAIIGIQPVSLAFDGPLSTEAARGIEETVAAIREWVER